MSCTVMYQPYAMSYSSSCDRTTDNKKPFKFPHAPSPPESSHSNASSAYSSPGSTGGGVHNPLQLGLSLLPPHLHSPSSALAAVASVSSSHSNNGGGTGGTNGQRRPLTPSCASSSGGGSGGGSSSSASATITSASQLSHHHHSHSSHHAHHHHHPHSHHHHSQQSSSSSAASSSSSSHNAHQLSHHQGSRSSSFTLAHSSHNLSSSSASATQTSRDLSHGPSSSSSSSAASSSSHQISNTGGGGASAAAASGDLSDDDSPGLRTDVGQGEDDLGASSNRAQYLSANCVLYVNYDGNTARVVEEHFNRALSAPYTGDKSSKSLPMSTRNFPASFWNSNYQPKATLASYGAADFYGTAMDYSATIPGFAHHHPQADPWHYPLGTHHHHHQSYHHRPSDITYPPMTSTSRFNAAQYGSFLFPSTSAAAAAARFPGIPTPGQCSVKGDPTHHWATGGRYDGWSDLHLAADYSAAAAAHYSNMTAAAGKGLDFETHYLQSS